MLRYSVIATLLVIPLLLAGCDKPPPPVVEAASRPVKTVLIEAPDSGGVRSLPARIDANRKAELAFRVPGKVAELLVREGDHVKEGQVVAKLDAADYQIVVNDRTATYENARNNFKRAKDLIDDGFISKSDYDRLEAELKSARATLDSAQQDLAYTELKAPFAGIIAQRHIERFEEVVAKQAVLSLQDNSLLEVKFDAPESLIRSIRAAEEARDSPSTLVKATASFTDLPGQAFPLTFKEISTRADDKTQTFQVTFTMEPIEGAVVLPGMTAMVTLDTSALGMVETTYSVPVSAVVGDYKLDPRVWVVDEKTMTVHPKPVKVGELTGDSIVVTDGLEPGQRIVTAGVPFLVEGMKVTLIPYSEQAQPRADESSLEAG